MTTTQESKTSPKEEKHEGEKEQRQETSVCERHSSFFLLRDNDDDEDSHNNDDDIVERKSSVSGSNSDHHLEEDPRLIWRDFEERQENSNHCSGGGKDSSGNELYQDVGDELYQDVFEYDNPSLTQEGCYDGACDEGSNHGILDRSRFPSDEFDKDRKLILDEIAAAAVVSSSPTSVIPSLSSPPGIHNSKSLIDPIRLEEGWNGSVLARNNVDDLNRSTSQGEDESSELQSESSTSAGVWSFASDAAWVPTLSDHDVANPNPYASLVMDSILGADNTEDLEPKEDVLEWTWVGNDKKESADSPPPPTQEIAFDAAGKDEEERLPSTLPSSTNSDGVAGTNKRKPSRNDDNKNVLDERTLSIMAASTYSKIFGIDYNFGSDPSGESDDEDDYDDWFLRNQSVGNVDGDSRYNTSNNERNPKITDSTKSHADETSGEAASVDEDWDVESLRECIVFPNAWRDHRARNQRDRSKTMLWNVILLVFVVVFVGCFVLIGVAQHLKES